MREVYMIYDFNGQGSEVLVNSIPYETYEEAERAREVWVKGCGYDEEWSDIVVVKPIYIEDNYFYILQKEDLESVVKDNELKLTENQVEYIFQELRHKFVVEDWYELILDHVNYIMDREEF